MNFDKPIMKFFYFEEYRTQLFDDPLNFMGLTSPKTLDYLNDLGEPIELPMHPAYSETIPIVIRFQLSD